MYVHDEPPPAWIEDDGQVGRRIVRRRHDVLRAEVWWAVAEAVRRCRALTGAGPEAPMRQFVRVTNALRDVGVLAGLLPPAMAPALPFWLPMGEQPFEDLVEWGPRPDLVDTLASAMCDELDMEDYTCPDRLAGLVDDLRLALDVYRSGVLGLIARTRAVVTT